MAKVRCGISNGHCEPTSVVTRRRFPPEIRVNLLGMAMDMRIAFDLDDTLIPGVADSPSSVSHSWQSLLGHEPIRAGTVSLMKELRRRGRDICIYTTSFRNPSHVRMLFWVCGVRIASVINQHRHNKTVTECGHSYRGCSKYPPAFGIDLLVERVRRGVARVAATRFQDGASSGPRIRLGPVPFLAKA